MLRKKILSILLVLGLLAVPLMLPSERADDSSEHWNEGQVWGYKWQIDMADLRDEIYDTFNTSTATIDYMNLTGGFSYFFYIKYLGEDSDGYMFEFRGGMYREIDYSMKASSNEKAVYEWLMDDSRKGYESGEYNGTFRLIKNSASYAGWVNPVSYYGISDLHCDILYEREMSSYSKYVWSHGNGSESDRYTKENIELKNVDIQFSPPIPFLPEDTENIQEFVSAIGVNSTYSADRSGHLAEKKTVTDWTAGIPGAPNSTSVDRDLTGHLSDSETVYSNQYVMVIKNLFSLASSDFSVDALKNCWADCLDYEGGFVSSIQIQESELMNMWWLKGSFESENATEGEVNKYLQNKRAYTPGIESSPPSPWFYSPLFIAVLVIVAVLTLSGGMLMKRRRRGP